MSQHTDGTPITPSQPSPLPPPVRLRCCCCGEETLGRQWFNRDTGYGLCRGCGDWLPAERNVSPEEMRKCYGERGVHYAIENIPKQPEF